MELAPGVQVTPSVQLVELLGVGGMGSVWVAHHASLDTRVAVKFISTELIRADPTIVDRFNREATLAAQIKNPHVVQTFDHGIMSDGRPYIVMELLEGHTLADRLAQGTLPLPLAQQVISQTAKALSRAHGLGIVHRDIKPDNLFLTYQDDELFLKVLDFGIAKRPNMPQSKDVTGTGAMVGTPEYMSPEQVLSAKTVDFRSDLWALGVVAYHCLTGVVPFTGETLGSICVAIAAGKLVPPTQLRPDLPETVDRWFEKALATMPERRFASAKELAATFAAALAGDVSLELQPAPDWSGPHRVTSPTSRPEAHAATFAGATLSPSRATRKRWRAVAIAAFATLTVGVLAFALVWRYAVTAETAPDLGAASESIAADEEPAPRPSASQATSAGEPSEPPVEPSAAPSASASTKELANEPPPQATSKMGQPRVSPKPINPPTPKPVVPKPDRGF